MRFRLFAFVFALLVLVASARRTFPKVEKDRCHWSKRLRISWPVTVGMKGEDAKAVVQAECQDCNVIVINYVGDSLHL